MNTGQYISWDLVPDIVSYVPVDNLHILSKASPMFDKVFVQMDLKVIIHKGIARVPKMTDLVIVTNSGQYIEYKEYSSYYEYINECGNKEMCFKYNVLVSSGLKKDCDLTRILISANLDDYVVYEGQECGHNDFNEGNLICIDLKNKMAFSRDIGPTGIYYYSLRRFRVLMKHGQWTI